MTQEYFTKRKIKRVTHPLPADNRGKEGHRGALRIRLQLSVPSVAVVCNLSLTFTHSLTNTEKDVTPTARLTALFGTYVACAILVHNQPRSPSG